MSEKSPDDVASQLVADLVDTPLPAAVEARLRHRLDAFEIRVQTQVVVPPSRWKSSRRVLLTIVVAVFAGVAVLTVALPVYGPTQALAQVADAVAKKPWLHAQGTGPNGEPAELWFSAKHGILGFRSGTTYVLVDQERKIMDMFSPSADPGAIHRMTLESPNSRGVAAARQSFLAMLSGDLQRAMKSGGQQILEQETTPMEVDGRRMIEHRFVIGNGDFRKECTLQVDPSTELPTSWQMKDGDKTICDYSVSYPDQGPLTIVALGAPKDVQTIDQTPSVQFQHILSATNAVKRQFDNYHAIVVQSGAAEPATAGIAMYHSIWRKGNRWRIDFARPPVQWSEAIPEGEIPKAWWLAQAKTMKCYPREIWDGEQFWLFDEVHDQPFQKDPDNPRYLRIASLQRTTRGETDPDDPSSPKHPIEQPEFYGYDHLDMGTMPGFQAEVQTAELNGRPLTRLDLVNTFARSPQQTSPFRYWLDPNRGFLIVHKDSFLNADPKQPVGVSEVIASEQTPQGFWYPTKMRIIGNSISLADNSRSDTYVRYFLDFDAEIPDELFDPSLVDLNNPWTVVK